MNELQIVIAVLAALALAYLFIYPTYAGRDVRKLAWLDMGVGAALLGLLAPFSWGSAPDYTFFFFDTPWWVFTILTYSLLELPLFYFYIKARGLGAEYRQLWTGSMGPGITAIASEKAVHKQLEDTKWDGLRSPRALKSLVISSNVAIAASTTFLLLVGDGIWSSMTLGHILILVVFWVLLRQAVRLIPEAPDSALDERMRIDRDRTYYTAYQLLFVVSGTLVAILIGYTIGSDISNSGDGFNYEFTLTFPQVQAIFWLIFGYGQLLPSMVMAWREAKRLEART